MPTFDTPGPLQAHITNAAGDIAVTSADTATTTVEVSAGSDRDRQAAEATTVGLRDGRLHIEVPHHHGWDHTPEIDIRVTIPTQSSIEIQSASADATLTGTYDAVQVRTASGDVRAENVSGPARLETASGDVSLDEAHGPVQINTASGDVRLGSALGDDPVEVSSASGDVTLELVHSGKVSVSTASGDVRVGIAGGVATWLDLHSLSGDIGTGQAGDDGPIDGEATLELRANTVSGDIRLHRVG